MELQETVILNDFCVGCGSCSSYNDSPYRMKLNEMGKYKPNLTNQTIQTEINVSSTCPFSDRSKNERILGDELFGNIAGINNNEYCGNYIETYAGYVTQADFRKNGSSGGVGTWIVAKLLQDNMIDAVIHVKHNKMDSNILYEYQISYTLEQLEEGAKSKYYPVELSQVIKHVKETPGRYAFIGVPCFVKAIRLLADEDEVIKKRIIYTIGLVCGHLKSSLYAKSIAWQMGFNPDQFEDIDFRIKLDGQSADHYGIGVKGIIKNKESTKLIPVDKLYTTNWGQGFFKLKACDYCDDVLAETADIAIGDAWIPEYIKDNMGTNILIIRSTDILDVIKRHSNEIHIESISIEKIYESQAGGFRHRREGLAYRLFLNDKKKEWRPTKRICASSELPPIRRKIYDTRIILREKSFEGYFEAVRYNDFQYFMSFMKPYVNEYNKLFRKPLLKRITNKVAGLLK